MRYSVLSHVELTQTLLGTAQNIVMIRGDDSKNFSIHSNVQHGIKVGGLGKRFSCDQVMKFGLQPSISCQSSLYPRPDFEQEYTHTQKRPEQLKYRTLHGSPGRKMPQPTGASQGGRRGILCLATSDSNPTYPATATFKQLVNVRPGKTRSCGTRASDRRIGIFSHHPTTDRLRSR